MSDDAPLIDFLTEQGLSKSEIEQVVKKLQEYDARMIHASVFDSIERGSFSLEDIIAEVKKNVQSS